MPICIKGNANKHASLLIRIPGWARGEVTPGGLYSFTDKQKDGWSIAVNGKNRNAEKLEKGYIRIDNVKKGDVLKIDEARGGGFAMSLIKK